jgi:magnesium chelatase family protein
MKPAEASAAVAKRVRHARAAQVKRQQMPNARLADGGIERRTRTRDDARATLARAVERHGLSARGFHRVLKVARTIADLDGSVTLCEEHAAEAVSYRGGP